ncbi:LOW QUALITY PROTEIN: crossover junction endonuclease MUS81 [Thamnophis elegans]|uniref:LOW QUALITY PROTEIN: crossover junction endonuclease MUS81 n=1 Tax=Thamnophis elegans TaxID=35005 RepID=UPI001376FD59|nr:LOW QUALITY PROTEIN: crossover junction endonuclease MUS81 [Thamnophis elegans]
MPKPPQEGPNPLFTRWLEEWRNQAAENGRLKSQRAYERALSSLRKYPLPLRSGREARILMYFGEKICRQLDEQLERHRSTQDGTALEGESPVLPAGGAVPASSCKSWEGVDDPTSSYRPVLPPALSSREPVQRQEQCSKKKQTVPTASAPGLHAHSAISSVCCTVGTLHNTKKPESRGYLSKPELQKTAQPLCDRSFFLADPGSKNSAWSAVSTLIRKELVLKTNIPARYSLTEAGLTVARELWASEEPKENNSSTPKPPAPQSGETVVLLEENNGSSSECENSDSSLANKYRSRCEGPNPDLSKPQFVLHPGHFEVILCVDFIETTGGPASRKQELVRELQRHNVPFSIRKLHVGDFLWVARERGPCGAEELPPTTVRELVLDYVVERKRMPDLCGSIIDGRFREQKFRLRQCGLSHPIYLVEDANSAQHLSLPEKTLQQAIVNTQVIDGFFVKRTGDVRESAAYLTIMTRHLSRQYGDKTLLSCTKQELEDERPLQPREGTCRLLTFAEFNEGAIKNKAQTVYEVFARQLMQVSGLSGEKAAAILEKYKTPDSLMGAYAACPDAETQEHLLSTIKCGQLQRNLGPSLSKTLAQLYCTPGPLP